MADPAKSNRPIQVTGRRPKAEVVDLQAWRRRNYVSDRVKELEAENTLLQRLAADSEQEISVLREILAARRPA